MKLQLINLYRYFQSTVVTGEIPKSAVAGQKVVVLSNSHSQGLYQLAFLLAMLESTCFLTASSMGCVIILLIFTNLRVEKWHLSIIFIVIYLIMGEFELFFLMFECHFCIFTCKFELLVHNFSDFFGVLVFYFSASQNSLYMKDVLRPLFVAYVANIYCQFISWSLLCLWVFFF